MDLTEGIIQHAAISVKGDGPANYQGTRSRPPSHLPVFMVDAIKEITGVDLADMSFEEAAALAGQQYQLKTLYCYTSSMLSLLNLLEETLIQPTLSTVTPLPCHLWLRKPRRSTLHGPSYSLS